MTRNHVAKNVHIYIQQVTNSMTNSKFIISTPLFCFPLKIQSLLSIKLSCYSLLWLMASLATQSHELEILESSLTPHFPLSISLFLKCLSKIFPLLSTTTAIALAQSHHIFFPQHFVVVVVVVNSSFTLLPGLPS